MQYRIITTYIIQKCAIQLRVLDKVHNIQYRPNTEIPGNKVQYNTKQYMIIRQQNGTIEGKVI